SQSVKKAIMNAHYHLKKFLKGLMDFPMYKTKKGQDMKVYFIQEDGDFQVERHRICIPDIGWIRLKEFGYLPLECVKNCAISYKAGKYFISVLYEVVKETSKNKLNRIKLGMNVCMDRLV